MNGLDGSTETTPTVRSSPRMWRDERADEARLPDPGRAGDADDRGAARLRIELADERVRERVAVLDERDRACERTAIARANAGDELLERPAPSAPRRDSMAAAAAQPGVRRDSRFAPRLDLLEERRDPLEPAARACRSSSTTSVHGSGSWPLARAATADSALDAIASCSSADDHGQPARHDERDEAATRKRQPAPIQTARAPTASVRTPAAAIPTPMTA